MVEAFSAILALLFIASFVGLIVGIVYGVTRKQWKFAIIGLATTFGLFVVVILFMGATGQLDDTEAETTQGVQATVPAAPEPTAVLQPTPISEPTAEPTAVFQPRPISEPTATPVVANTPTEPAPIDPEQILNDYHTNETAAELKWKGERLLVVLENIDEIRDRGRVQKSVSPGDLFSFDIVIIELDFAKDTDVVDLTPGDTVMATCRFDGYDTIVVDWLKFRDCVRHE